MVTVGRSAKGGDHERCGVPPAVARVDGDVRCGDDRPQIGAADGAGRYGGAGGVSIGSKRALAPSDAMAVADEIGGGGSADAASLGVSKRRRSGISESAFESDVGGNGGSDRDDGSIDGGGGLIAVSLAAPLAGAASPRLESKSQRG